MDDVVLVVLRCVEPRGKDTSTDSVTCFEDCNLDVVWGGEKLLRGGEPGDAGADDDGVATWPGARGVRHCGGFVQSVFRGEGRLAEEQSQVRKHNGDVMMRKERKVTLGGGG